MENYLLDYDGSCHFGYWFCNQKECFKLPVVYKDGLVSRIRSVLKGRIPLGILCEGYIIAIKQVPRKMTPEEAKEYCDGRFIAGRPVCVPPRKVMRALLKNVATVNEILRDIGGDVLSAGWYMATDDEFTSSPGGFPCDDIMLGISLGHLDDYDCKEGKICWEVVSDTKIAFYPAVEV